MAGAAQLCGEAAYRAGAGLVTIATHPENASSISTRCPEIMSAAISSGNELEPWFEWATVVAIGPGLGRTAWSQDIWKSVVKCERRLIVDADALNILAECKVKRADWILTPHPGEAARLLRTEPATVQANRFASVKNIADQFGGVCVLKGSGTLIDGDELGGTWLCDRGNAGMATGGMGDVLTGVIAGLCAQGLSLPDAARLGVWAHACAGDRAVSGHLRGMIASDLIPQIRNILNGS